MTDTRRKQTKAERKLSDFLAECMNESDIKQAIDTQNRLLKQAKERQMADDRRKQMPSSRRREIEDAAHNYGLTWPAFIAGAEWADATRYPTVHAYEKACEALEKKTQALTMAKEALEFYAMDFSEEYNATARKALAKMSSILSKDNLSDGDSLLSSDSGKN